jgi:hypothetical protein
VEHTDQANRNYKNLIKKDKAAHKKIRAQELRIERLQVRARPARCTPVLDWRCWPPCGLGRHVIHAIGRAGPAGIESDTSNARRR